MLDQPDMPEWAREAYAKHGPRIDSFFHNQKRETALIAVAEAATKVASVRLDDGVNTYVRADALNALEEALAKLEAVK